MSKPLTLDVGASNDQFQGVLSLTSLVNSFISFTLLFTFLLLYWFSLFPSSSLFFFSIFSSFSFLFLLIALFLFCSETPSHLSFHFSFSFTVFFFLLCFLTAIFSFLTMDASLFSSLHIDSKAKVSSTGGSGCHPYLSRSTVKPHSSAFQRTSPIHYFDSEVQGQLNEELTKCFFRRPKWH